MSKPSPPMKSQELDLSNPAAMAAFASDEAMSAWGVLRRAKEPLSVAELAKRVEVGVASMVAALDLLEAIGLVRKLRAGGRRKGITYRTDFDELMLVMRDDPEGRTLLTRLIEITAVRQDGVLARMHPSRSTQAPGQTCYSHASEFRATDADIRELSRRIAAVTSFTAELVRRMDNPQTDEPMVPAHGLYLRLAPIVGAIKDAPIIKLRNDSAYKTVQDGRRPVAEKLAKREREVGALLQRGLSRAEIAARLDVSIDTVGSHCKRLYKKLGITRATELSAFSFDAVTSVAARRTHGSAPRGG